MRGRWGFEVKDEMSFAGEMSEVTPGKCVSKKVGTEEGLLSKVDMWEEGRKSVHVKDPSYCLLASSVAMKALSDGPC